MSWGNGAWGGGEGWSIDDPSISNASPADLSDLGRMQALEFDAEDLDPGLAVVFVWMRYEGDVDWLVVFDGADFLGTFERESERTSISNGYHFSILPAGGWRKPFAIKVRALDAAGHEDA